MVSPEFPGGIMTIIYLAISVMVIYLLYMC